MPPFVATTVDREEMTSTSDEARRLVESGDVALPLLVRARRQTAGRGQRERKWWSDEGSLTFTLALDPLAHGLRRDHEPRLALVAAVGLIESLEASGTTAALGLRWPNDVESDGRKLAGILVERVETISGPRLLVGIGVNVSTDFHDAPEDVRRLATSVRLLTESSWTPDTLLTTLLDAFPRWLALLARDDSSLPRAWAAVDALRGTPVRLAIGPDIVEGVADGIDPAGGLIVVDDRGPRTYYAGQVLRSAAGPLP